MGRPVYFEIEIAFNESNYDEIYHKLYITGITTIVEENGVIKASLPVQNLNILKDLKTTLINNNTVKSSSIHISQFEDKDWNREWEKSIEPVYIKDKIIIYPSWKRPVLQDTEKKILIEIDPKMSFGTGHNETTQLVLELMCSYINEGDKSMLDFGCGTGILAIAGVKLGIESVIAIDKDDDSICNAREYAEKNNAAGKIIFYLSGIENIKENNFDIICANITRAVIITNIKNIYDKLKSTGKLLISGILNEEKKDFMKELTNIGFEIHNTLTKDVWAGIYCTKR